MFLQGWLVQVSSSRQHGEKEPHETTILVYIPDLKNLRRDGSHGETGLTRYGGGGHRQINMEEPYLIFDNLLKN